MIVSSAWTRRCPVKGFIQRKEGSYRQGSKCSHFLLDQKDVQDYLCGVYHCTLLPEEVNKACMRTKEEAL